MSKKEFGLENVSFDRKSTIQVNEYFDVDVDHNSILCTTFDNKMILAKEVEFIKRFPAYMGSRNLEEIKMFKTKTFICSNCRCSKEFTMFESHKQVFLTKNNLFLVLNPSTKEGKWEVLNKEYNVIQQWNGATGANFSDAEEFMTTSY